MATRRLLLFAVGLGLSLWSGCVVGEPSANMTIGHAGSGKQDLRSCSVDDLLPLPTENNRSSEWSEEYIAEPPYNCTCPTIKGGYFCRTQESVTYPKWEPLAVTQGLCNSPAPSDMAGGPFPPKFKILVYGNSHLRQVVEAMMCMFPDEMTSKKVVFDGPPGYAEVPGDTQCRACSKRGNQEDFNKSMLKNQCISSGKDCSCNDNRSEYFFENGAAMYYKFSNSEVPKTLTKARRAHGKEALSSYDAVIMNEGNEVAMTADEAIMAAIEAQHAETPFFWLSTYTGGGRLSGWSEDQATRFSASGARYVDIYSMVKGMEAWTKGAAVGTSDEHYCLPGPPDEIAVLLRNIVWAVYEEDKGG